MYRIVFLFICFFITSCATTTTWYIVRHAEKESGAPMTASSKSSNVPLSEQGMKRAEALKKQLQYKKINYIYSTNTIRTKSTAAPLSQAIGVPVQIYNSVDTSFLQVLKNADRNILVVAHSNTVDDLVNGLMNENVLTDLTDAQYGDLFIIHKKGKKIDYEVKRFE